MTDAKNEKNLRFSHENLYEEYLRQIQTDLNFQTLPNKDSLVLHYRNRNQPKNF